MAVPSPPLKALLVSFYFPPAGGGGVQRPLKLAQYLPTMGIETHVLAPDDPRWLHRDEGLRMPSQAWVHRARYVGVSGGKPSEVLAGTQGLERAVTHARLQLRRLVVPDENATWAITAIPAGIRLVREHGIDVVVSTSPPGSTHLIAAAIARATGIRWVADLRDSLVAHAHRRADTTATKAKAALHERVARLVAGRADAITCVSEAISEETRALAPRGPVVTIPNGADFDDVAGLERRPSDRFRITHTGSFFGRRDPRPFLQALADSGLDVEARFLGDFRETDRAWAETLALGDRLRLLPYAPRTESLALQRDSEALLLLIPEAGGRGKGVLSGKVFEYVAVGRPILAVVPPDGAAAELIRETGAGVVAAPEDVGEIRSALEELHRRWRATACRTSSSPRTGGTASRAARASRRWPPCCAIPSPDRRRGRTVPRRTGRARSGRRPLLRRRDARRAGMALSAGVRRRESRGASQCTARPGRSRARRRELGAARPGDRRRGAGVDPRGRHVHRGGRRAAGELELARHPRHARELHAVLPPAAPDEPRRTVDPLLRVRPERVPGRGACLGGRRRGLAILRRPS